jgi:hypothetical protein
MRATRCCGWAVVAMLVVAAPAAARAATAQVIAPRDVGADLAVGPGGRAFVVSPSARPASGTLSAVRRRSALPGTTFGPSRLLMGSGATDRPVDTGVAADGSGMIVLQRVRAGHRSVRAVAFGTRGRLGTPIALSTPGARADFAASAVAPSGAAVVVWFRHRGARRWRLEAATRAPGARRFGAPEPLSAFVRRPCCTSVFVSIGERGDAVATWSSTARPAVWAALRSPGQRFRRPQQLAADASDAPRAVVGPNGAAAVIYSAQHVPLRPGDGLQLHRALRGGTFGPAEHVNPGGGVTVADAAVNAAGRVLVAWCDRVHSARVRVSEAAQGEPLAATAELGADVSAKRIALAADDDGRAVVAWSQRASSAAGYRERAFAALRPAPGTPFGQAVALGRPWRAAEPGLARLVPGGGALVVWNRARYAGPAQRRSAVLVTRLP